MVSGHFPVPERIPGTLITDEQHLYMLKEMLALLCNQAKFRFPGSQPVSFTNRSLDLLQKEDFWVCEKSDGVRVLVMALGTDDGPPEVYLVDRKEEYYLNLGFAFPHHEDPTAVHVKTVIDAELVIDVHPKTGQQTLRLLMFDLLVLDGENLMKRPLSSRYGRLNAFVYEPFKRMMRENPHIQDQLPFDIMIKKMEKAYGIEAVLKEHLPALQHGSDGLIFTSAVGPYVTGTDERILKWKPPTENSIDFRLELRFPPQTDNPSKPDFGAKPIFLLMMNCGTEPEQIFDQMLVDDAEWEEMKESGIQFDNRIIEVAWSPAEANWKLLRFREDKTEGNYKDVVQRILVSIRDGVEHEGLIAQAGLIKQGWKAREAALQRKQQEKQQAYASAKQQQPQQPFVLNQ